MDFSEESRYRVALSLIPKVGGQITRQLMSYCGSAKNIFDSSAAKLDKIPGIGQTIARAVNTSDVLKKADEIISKAEKYDIQLLYYTDKEYPARLKEINDAPALLYYKGSANLNHPRTISIVGTRKMTDYGRMATEQLVEGLKSYNVLIISGLAYGVDITAHRSALQYGIPTLGAMASGLDIIYPAQHKGTADKMFTDGGLISEYPLGTKPDPRQFPARNRIIAGMSDAVIVVEAAKKGGALITAEMAFGYNRDVYAIPGRLDHTYSEGCNYLIRNNKASILTAAKDLEYYMNWDEPPAKSNPAQLTIDLPDDEKTVYEVLATGKAFPIDEISWKSQISINKVASILLSLEIKGVVKPLPGKKFQCK